MNDDDTPQAEAVSAKLGISLNEAHRLVHAYVVGREFLRELEEEDETDGELDAVVQHVVDEYLEPLVTALAPLLDPAPPGSSSNGKPH